MRSARYAGEPPDEEANVDKVLADWRGEAPTSDRPGS